MVNEEYLKAQEVAAQLHVTPQTIYGMVKRGELPGAIRLGRRSVRIPVSALDTLRTYQPTGEAG